MSCPDPKQRRYRRPAWHFLNWRNTGIAAAATLLVAVFVAHTFIAVGAGPFRDELGEESATDTKHDKGGTSSVGKKPHAKPPKHAKTPPCTPKAEREVNGACYLIMKMAPPCPPERYEDGGECLALQYVAPNTSVEE